MSGRKFSVLVFFLLVFLVLARAQEEKLTLILHGGEEIPCQIRKIAHDIIYFEAASTQSAFKWGEMIEIGKVAAVRRSNGQTVSIREFLEQRNEVRAAAETAIPKPMPPAVAPSPRMSAPPARPSGPGMRLKNKLQDTTRTASAIGLRLPEIPALPTRPELDYSELADLLAETGLAGKLLYEISAGALRGRILTKGQQELVDAILMSPAWSARRQDLRQAQNVAKAEFNLLTQRQPDLISGEFHFRPLSQDQAYVEFIQFLHLENVPHFQDKWEKIRTIFGDEAAAAIRDILNNYEDWYYLFGQESEKR
ncbi:MAG: hypothetical protein ONB44_07005 [candidate division KSB1 bacterium]|nr:hypothetical protein [candidate division KSB1 bacterium]